MAYCFNYAVSGLQEKDKMNVLSLEERAGEGNTLRCEHSGNQYVVLSCGEPSPNEFEAAKLAINGVVTLRVALLREVTAATLPIDEWTPGQVSEIVGNRQDDLPCYECGQYGYTLIVKTGYETRDICHGCAILLGVKW